VPSYSHSKGGGILPTSNEQLGAVGLGAIAAGTFEHLRELDVSHSVADLAPLVSSFPPHAVTSFQADTSLTPRRSCRACTCCGRQLAVCMPSAAPDCCGPASCGFWTCRAALRSTRCVGEGEGTEGTREVREMG
jgi:hypothetical protein